jgi:hypothetical protein
MCIKRDRLVAVDKYLEWSGYGFGRSRSRPIFPEDNEEHYVKPLSDEANRYAEPGTNQIQVVQYRNTKPALSAIRNKQQPAECFISLQL